MRLSVFATQAGITFFFAACNWGNALDSDPTAWNPPAGLVSATSSAEPDASAIELPPEPTDCSTLPELDLKLKASTASLRSHRSSEPCLASCHEPGGTAKLAFAAAGSAYTAQGKRSPAQAGKVIESVGGSRLIVDSCGNFYAVESALRSSVKNTQPWLQEPTFHRMEKPLARASRAGDCNQSGCHDFSGRLNSGIYF
jgi:hypothetical protein